MSISIVIPALDAAGTIGAQLQAISEQDLDGTLEVVIADNGSTDDTATTVSSFADRLEVRVVDASVRRGPSAARNAGAAAAQGDVLLFCDADDVVLPGWARTLRDCVRPGQVAVGSFRLMDADAREVPTDWVATESGLPRYLGQVPLTYSSNLGVTKQDFERAGGFDEALRCGEDADFGIRLQQLGCRIAWCPEARVVMRNRETVRGQFRQFAQYGRWDAAVYRKHRDGALRRPPLRDALRDYASLIVHLPRLFDPDQRRSWVVTAGQRAGRVVGSIKERVFLP